MFVDAFKQIGFNDFVDDGRVVLLHALNQLIGDDA